MSDINTCLWHYRRLLDLYEEDLLTMKRGLQGDLLDAYAAVVKREISEVNKHMNSLRRVAKE